MSLVQPFPPGVLPLNQQRNDGTNKKHDNEAEQTNDDIAQSCQVVEIQVTIVVSISSKGTRENILGHVGAYSHAVFFGMGVDEGLHTICIQFPIVGCCLFGIGELEVEFSLVYPYTNRLKKERYRDIH